MSNQALVNPNKVEPVKNPSEQPLYGEQPQHMHAFEMWYTLHRNGVATAKQLGIGKNTLFRWRDIYFWERRADERDRARKILAQEVALDRMADALEKQFDASTLLLDRGIEFLKNTKIDTTKDAISAIDKGITLQRRVMELPDWVVQLKNSDDVSLVKRAEELADELNRRKAERSRNRAGAAGDPGGVGEEGNLTGGIFGPEDDATGPDSVGSGLLALSAPTGGFLQGCTQHLSMEQADRGDGGGGQILASVGQKLSRSRKNVRILRHRNMVSAES